MDLARRCAGGGASPPEVGRGGAIGAWDAITGFWETLQGHARVGVMWVMAVLFTLAGGFFIVADWEGPRRFWPWMRETAFIKLFAVALFGIVYLLLVPLVGVPWSDELTVWGFRVLLGVMFVAALGFAVLSALEMWFGRTVFSGAPPETQDPDPGVLPAGVEIGDIKVMKTVDEVISSPVGGGVNLVASAAFRLLPPGAQARVVRVIFPPIGLLIAAVCVYGIIVGPA